MSKQPPVPRPCRPRYDQTLFAIVSALAAIASPLAAQPDVQKDTSEVELRFSVRIQDHGYGIRELVAAVFSEVEIPVPGTLTLRLRTSAGPVDCVNDQPVWIYGGDPANVGDLSCLAITTPATMKDMSTATATVTNPDDILAPRSYRCRESTRTGDHVAFLCSRRSAIKEEGNANG